MPVLQSAHRVLIALLRYDVLCSRLLHQHHGRALLQVIIKFIKIEIFLNIYFDIHHLKAGHIVIHQ